MCNLARRKLRETRQKSPGSAAVAALSTALIAVLLSASPAGAHSPPSALETGVDTFAAGTLGAAGAGDERVAAASCEGGNAGPYPCKRVDLESFVPLPLLGGATGNDIWGWTDPQTGREYALVGTSFGTGFVDVTNAKNPRVVGVLPTRGTPDFVLWREVWVDGNYAYIVSEVSGSGLQVFDLTRLRGATGSTPTLFTSDATYDEFDFGHTIAINEETNVAYINGSDTCVSNEGTDDEENGGLHMVDISDPLDPSFLGCAIINDNDGDPDTDSNNYVHDVQCVIYRGPDPDYQGREVCFSSNENIVAIWDVTDKANPVLISQVPYDTAAYTHQGWLTEGQRFFIFNDELDEGPPSGGTDPTVQNTTTYILDVGDLNAPGVPKPFTHKTRSIDHNLYNLDGRVYQSNYTAGLRILDYSPSSLAAGKLEEVAFFDVVPGVDVTEFAGTWGNYPYFKSGIVVVSTIENETSGLFVLRPRLGDGAGQGGGDGTGADRRCPNAITGSKGADRLKGTARADRISAKGGRDRVSGRAGGDCVRGGGGKDRIRGGAGADEIRGGRQKDRVRGEGGGDEIRVVRGGRDHVNCGPGDDVVFASRSKDRVGRNCERVKTR